MTIPAKKLIFVLGSLLISLLMVNIFWPYSELSEVVIKVSRWPLSPKTHLELARIYFNNGYQVQANEEIQKAKLLKNKYLLINSGKKLERQFEEIDKLNREPQTIKAEINFWEKVLETKPSSKDIFLRLAILHTKIYQDDKAKEYWQKANYLDPNNELVQKVGGLLKN